MPLAPASSNFFQVLIDNLGQEQQDTTEITKAGEVDPAMLQDIFSLMVVAYAERREERELVIDGLASATIALASPAIRRPPGRRRPDDLVALLLTEIAAHPESVTLQGLAERFSYNPTYLSGLLHAQCVRRPSRSSFANSACFAPTSCLRTRGFPWQSPQWLGMKEPATSIGCFASTLARLRTGARRT